MAAIYVPNRKRGGETLEKLKLGCWCFGLLLLACDFAYCVRNRYRAAVVNGGDRDVMIRCPHIARSLGVFFYILNANEAIRAYTKVLCIYFCQPVQFVVSVSVTAFGKTRLQNVSYTYYNNSYRFYLIKSKLKLTAVATTLLDNTKRAN